MRLALPPIALLASTLTCLGAGESVIASESKKNQVATEAGAQAGVGKQTPDQGEGGPVYLTASELSIATGKPSLTVMSSGSVQVPIWSLSGGTPGQSVAGLVTGLPSGCAAVKVEIMVTTTDAATSPQHQDVYRVHLSQMVGGCTLYAAVLSGLPGVYYVARGSFLHPDNCPGVLL